MQEARIGKLVQLIREASTNGVKASHSELSGFSGTKLIGTLQRLASSNIADDECYLEIGVFQGLTLLSVASVLGARPAIGIDNFAQFDPKSENLGIVEERIRNMAIQNASIVNMDYEDALENLPAHTGGRKVSVYFIDGPHDYRSQLMCLELAKEHLSPSAVILVDDSNYQHVRQANRDFLLLNPDFKLLFQAYTKCHPANMDAKELRDAQSGWWNGVNILVSDPTHQLRAEFPATARDRTIFVNDHIVHGSSLAVCSDRAVRVVSSLLHLRPIRAFGHFAKLLGEIRKKPANLKGQFESANTYSETLPESAFNSAVP